MKKTLFILGVVSVLVIGVVGGCAWSGWRTAIQLVNNTLQQSTPQFKLFGWCFNGLPFVDQLPALLDHKRFIVLLQNNMEIRPTGGFMGSYAVITTAPTGIGEIKIQDIYVPDGQLVGHVDPPTPIQQAFGQGWWKLRDANWDVDFSVAAEQVAWFFDQGGETTDGIIAINLSLVQQLLPILGPIKLLDFPDTITAENIYPVTQTYAEQDSFPGSTQKKDFLSAIGREVVIRLKGLSPRQVVPVAKLIFKQLKNKDIMLWFTNPSWQQTAEQRNWTGSMSNLTGNFVSIVDTNLGANKANCCVEQRVEQTMRGDVHNLKIVWVNANKFTNPVKPFFWGGDYINYVRVVLPKNAQVQTVATDQPLVKKELDYQYGIQADRFQIEEQDQYQVVGFWVQVPAQSSGAATLSWKLANTNLLKVLRQSGVPPFAYRLYKDDKLVIDEKITAEREFKF